MNEISKNFCSLVIEGIGRRAYVNSLLGREQLEQDLKGKDETLLAEVLTIWGNMPTVEDEIEPEKTFDELKAEKLTEMSANFDHRVSGYFTTPQGYLMQFDTSDSIKMQGAITLMGAVGSAVGYITQANDVTVYNVPIETMKQVLVEMLNAYAQCHARKQELRALINNAQTKEELAAIEITWPV